ncbi:uncharacterized protein LOC103519719 [Diaphorina citri]|uniref:Uncharacterized protein LOC103519719 n=1 Tax=Diaphorina citri TaxID=121845 RepID=A0A1S3DJS1_DIACI|nr:uncharacterized protein LOC103519719 [Diaphorina citri]
MAILGLCTAIPVPAGLFAKPSVYFSSNAITPLHTVTKSQFHTQDELGQYSYGYADDLSSKTESKSLDGITHGSYSYLDSNGIVQSQYSYGYADGLSSKTESKSLDGITHGSYSYLDSNGIVQSVNYIADDVNGFRVAASNLPVGPAAVAVNSAAVPVPQGPAVPLVPSGSPVGVHDHHLSEPEPIYAPVQPHPALSDPMQAGFPYQPHPGYLSGAAPGFHDIRPQYDNKGKIKMVNETVDYHFTYMPKKKLDILNEKLVKAYLKKWGLEGRIQSQCFTFNESVHHQDMNRFLEVKKDPPNCPMDPRIVVKCDVTNNLLIRSQIFKVSASEQEGDVAKFPRDPEQDNNFAYVIVNSNNGSYTDNADVLQADPALHAPLTSLPLATPPHTYPYGHQYHHVSAPNVMTQYHSQDELGQYSYGYAGGPSAKTEIKTLDGVTRGSYSYIDANGEVQSVNYISDATHGFRVSASNLPSAPSADHDSNHLTETPEVARAKSLHFAAHEQARRKVLVASA